MIWVARLIGWACFISSLEFLSLRAYFREGSIWRWSEIKKEHATLPYLDFLFFDFLLSDKYFHFFLISRLMASVALIFFPESFGLSFFLFISSLLLALRFRGSFNGGSDYMSLVVLSALCVSNSTHHPKIINGAALYIALQLCTSYFIAGVVKIKQTTWRKGIALQSFLTSPNYLTPSFLIELIKNKSVSLIASWSIILFELLFPLVFFLSPQGVMIAIAFAFSFHLMNNIAFGLNRFMWVWLSTFPALYFSVIYLASMTSR